MDLFEDGNDLPIVDPSKDYLTELVGEGRKYKTPADLARAVVEKEAYVQRLQNETKGLRTDLQGRIKLEDLLTKFDQRVQPEVVSTPQGESDTRTNTPQLPDFEKLIEQRLNAKEAEKAAKDNERIVLGKLAEAYGDNYANRVKSELQKVGMTTEQGTKLLRENPDAFLRLLGVGHQQKKEDLFQPQSAVSFTPNTQGRTYAYYQQLRQEKPTEYWSPRVQNEMLKKLADVGPEEFYKG